MKNLPEKDMFNELEKRLSNYSENPDEETWDNIMGALPRKKSTAGLIWFDRVSVAALIALLAMVIMQNASITQSPLNQDVISSSSEQRQILDSEIDRKNVDVKAKELSKRIQRAAITIPLTKVAYILNDVMSQLTNANELNKNVTESILFPLADRTFVHEQIIDTTYNERDGRNFSIVNSKGMESQDSVKQILSTDSIKGNDKNSTARKAKKTISARRSTFYFLASPSLAYHKITPTLSDQLVVTRVEAAGIFNANRIGFSTEAGYQTRVTKYLEVYAGLSYYHQNQQIVYYYQSPDQVEVNTSPGELVFSVSPSENKRTVNYKMRNLGVSVGFWHLIKAGVLQHKIGAGLQYQKGFYNQQATYNNSKSSYFNYHIAYRVEFSMNSKTKFFVQPGVNYTMKSNEHLSEPFSVKPYRAAMGFGMLYQF